MKQQEQIQALIKLLLQDLPQYQQYAERFKADYFSQRRLLRGLMNVRQPIPLSFEYLMMQNELLCAERDEKGVIDVWALPTTKDPRMVIWQGDITRLNADAIVDAANSALLGCFVPLHGCIDNAIHSAAGLQLRDECNQIMIKQGYAEPTGNAKITKAYNLPSRNVLHTVGPIIYHGVSDVECIQLESCYFSCLDLAVKNGAKSIAFCCISTGEFHFPNREAAQIAVKTVSDFLSKNRQIEKVIFDVFSATDLSIYQELLPR